MKRVFLIAFLVSFSTQQCAAGCLKCSAQNSCLLCDSTTLYYLNSSANACMRSALTNCQLIDQSNNCLVCANGYYVDSNTKSCVALTSVQTISNCIRYSSTRGCTACLSSFFLFVGVCQSVNKVVANCQVYSNNGICAQCNKNYVTSLDGLQCISLPTGNNCMQYTFVGCRNCTANHLLNENFYATNYMNLNFLTADILAVKSATFSGAVKSCQSITVSNCLVLSSASSCAVCKVGFFLQNGTCVQNPALTIAFCKVYSSSTTCTGCVNGYYLSANKCVANTPIAGCQAYNPNASSNLCVACNATSYVSNNACVARSASLSIPKCYLTTPNADTCQTCNPNYVLTSDRLACLQMIANCATYAASTSSTTALACTLCQQGYYIVSNTTGSFCVAGDIEHCQVYALSANNCAVCINGFYLSSNACLAHVSIQNCLIYDASSANKCSICAVGYQNFAFYQVCTPITTITYCLVYSLNGQSCTSCAGGYYVTSTGQCAQIDTTAFPNCATTVNSVCTVCSTNYVLGVFSPGLCTTIPSYVTATCAATSTSASGYCLTCNQNTYYFTPAKSEAICVSAPEIARFQGFAQVPNCKRFGLNRATNAQIVCMACENGYFLTGYWPNASQNTGTGCTSTCTTSDGSNVIIVDDLFGFVNICVSAGSGQNQIAPNGCQRLTRFTSFNSGSLSDFVCLAPQQGHSAVTNFPTSSGYLFMANSASPTSVLSMDVGSNFLGNPHSFQITSNFESYPTVLNYYGIVPNIVASSSVTPPASMTNCDILFILDSNGSAFVNDGARSGFFAAAVGTTHSCRRCNFGYQPTFVTPANSGNSVVPTCVSMGSSCSSTATVYGGLPSFLASTFSCHVCAPASGIPQYPIVYMEYDAKTAANGYGVLIQYSFPAVTNNVPDQNHGFRCGTAPTTITTANSSPTSNAQVTYCAAFGVLSAQTAGAAMPTVVMSYCLACSGGSYPIYYGLQTAKVTGAPNYVPSYIITSCQVSNKCDTNSGTATFNSCARCTTLEESLSTPVYYGFSDFRLINCLPTPTRNCFIVSAASPSTSNKNACIVCKSGYFLNADGFCDSITSTSISQNSNFVVAFYDRAVTSFAGSAVSGYDAAYVRVHHLLNTFGMFVYGEQSCGANYVLGPSAPGARSFCITSSYATGSARLTPTTFVAGCSNYKFSAPNSGFYSCQMCLNNQMLTDNFRSCVAPVANCLYAYSTTPTLCGVCPDGTLNINGVCSTQTIGNCTTHVNTVNYGVAALSCSVCNSGFYISIVNGVRKCQVGSIQNCASYVENSPNTCLSCSTGFTLLILSNSATICYPVSSSLSSCNLVVNNAGTNGVNGFAQGFINCQSCSINATHAFVSKPWNSVVTSTSPQSLCLPFPLTPNCTLYSQNNTNPSQNTFNCLQCANGFFYNSTSANCVARTLNESNCATLSQTADLCTACNSGFYLNQTGTACIPFPTGVPRCSVYSDIQTCVSCIAGYYVANNTCTLSATVADCQNYTANGTCSVCSSGYYLTNNTCVVATATGCLTYTNITACALCPAGYGLQPNTASGTVDCAQISISSCQLTNSVAPFACLVCQTGFYPDSTGNCQQVAQTVSNCAIYDTNVTCRTCKPGTVLSPSRTICDPVTYSQLTDSLCTDSFASSQPICAQCSPGYFLANGSCYAAAGQSTNPGCLYFDFASQTSCLLCQSGYYMDQLTKCNAVLTNQTNATPTTPNRAFGLSFAAALLLTWLFRG